MAFQIPPRTGVVTTTTGTGAYALGTTALATHRTFAQAVSAGWLADGDTVPYWCADAGTPAAIEEGIGTYNAGANTLTRTTIFRSSNGGAAINWAGGSKDLVVGFTSTGILALLAATNVFTADQVIRKTTPIFDLDALSGTDSAFRFLVSGTRRARTAWVGAGPYVEVVYRNTSEIDKGAIRVGDGTLRFYDGTNSYDVDRFPSGTALVFHQSAVPAGWTKLTTQNDKALRVVSGTGGGSGGSRALSAATVGAHALTISQMPSHAHGIGTTSSGGSPATALLSATVIPTEFFASQEEGNDAAHDHALALAYIDVIVGIKNA